MNHENNENNRNGGKLFLIGVCTLMMFIPWTILPLRTFPWALESPTAEIMISCYAAFMIFSGIFTMIVWCKCRMREVSGTAGVLMKLCVLINIIYAMGGAAAFVMMFSDKFSDYTLPFSMPWHIM